MRNLILRKLAAGVILKFGLGWIVLHFKLAGEDKRQTTPQTPPLSPILISGVREKKSYDECSRWSANINMNVKEIRLPCQYLHHP